MSNEPKNEELEEKAAEEQPETQAEYTKEKENSTCPHCGKDLAESDEEEMNQESEEEAVNTEHEEMVDEEEQKPDARAEFKEFVNAFGPDRAANYFAAGFSMEAAKAAYMDELVKENADLKAKLASSETVKPVASKPSDDSDVPVTFTREQIRRMSAEDYRKHRNEINKAQAEGRIK